MKETKNILNEFKNVMGAANVTNQYVELHKRYFNAHFSSSHSPDTNLDKESKSFGLNLSSIYNEAKINLNISNSYIVNVHASFMYFLDQYCSLPGFPFGAKEDKIDSLTWIISQLYHKESERPENVHMWYEICNYYRLVRNHAVHIKDESRDLKTSYSRIQKYILKHQEWKIFCGELSAPSQFDSISFDDQVLYSKAAFNLAVHIFEYTKYDLLKHAQQEQSTINNLICKYDKNPKRKLSILKTYFERIYSFSKMDYNDDLKRILLEIK